MVDQLVFSVVRISPSVGDRQMPSPPTSLRRPLAGQFLRLAVMAIRHKVNALLFGSLFARWTNHRSRHHCEHIEAEVQTLSIGAELPENDGQPRRSSIHVSKGSIDDVSQESN